jgi:hypothetical protein
MVFQNDILAGASGAGGGYTIDQSIRFNDDDSAYLSRTAGSTGNRQKWTFSAWVKRGTFYGGGGVSSNQRIFHDSGNNNWIMFGYNGNEDVFRVYLGADLRTTALFRDPSAWYHLVVAVDTTQATSSDRVKIYQNGVQITSFSAAGYPSLNYNTIFNNSGTTYQISGQSVAEYFDGYISEFHWIDGQQLAPTDFGETNNDGVWVPKAYAGTYGTNGFYITGEDSADLGADFSGNGNDFTSSGLTSDDQVTDTPTENYCTLNPLYGAVSYPATFSNGNLTASGSGGVGRYAISTMGATSGKWYSEVEVDSMSTPVLFRIVVGGWSNLYDPLLFSAGEAAPQINSVLYMGDGRRRINNSDTTSWGATFTTGDVIGVAYDADTGKVWFAKNNSWQSSGNPAAGTNPAATLTTGAPFYSGLNPFDSGTGTVNFGQLGFTYTPPTGFSALSTANLPAPTIADGSAYFQATTYTGAGYPTEVNQSGNSTFQPDFVWVKRRNGATTHDLFDAVRGVSSQLYSNLTNAEGTVSNAISFDADGFTAAADPITGDTGSSGNTFVGWQWLAANGTASNTDGSITSTVSANTTAGFSVIGYTGNATSGATIGHGLGVAPAMVITKSRDNGTGRNWAVYHSALGPTKYLELDNTNLANVGSTRWNNTAPSSTVITLGSQQTTNDSGAAMIAYAFAEVEGFSKFGSYTGNGSLDGPFVWCGFRPSFLMVKRTDVASDWFMLDNQRPGYNVIGGGGVGQLPANLTYAESSLSTYAIVDFLSNGFKVRHDMTYGYWNASGGTYIFMAFAEHPLGGDGVAPVPAR